MHNPVSGDYPEVGTASVADALDELGLDGVVDGPQRIIGSRRFIGPAVTVRLEPGQPGRDDGRRFWQAVDTAQAGSVLVVAAGGAAISALGGVIVGTAAARGLVGAVTDGLIRDADEMAGYDLPVHYRRAHPRAIRPCCPAIGGPVRFGAVEVAPGDLVVADGDGVVSVPLARADEVLDRACRIEELERRWVGQARAHRSIAAGFEAVGDEFGPSH
ncbi:RraA family protein [Umezawaea endophytica]|uniref:Putative 4-hydroxy-4-methyl-2-oxoglutarate aldolase n=1 Tax=Umezawaea endophytica TaxID=1654476 RepID=A0A9X2VTG3_9PSEU|nr:RraA family protein [Umezawaea endophytica]MCS7482508.1 RraA family protein [Umezawaea endophytica]